MQNVTFTPWKRKKRNSLSNNWWKFECFYPNGQLKWTEIIHNIVVDEGLQHALEVLFLGATQYSNWYVELYESDSTPDADWAYATIGTDQTPFEDYDEVTRPQWTPSAVSNLALTEFVAFTASTGVNTTLYGGYVVNVSTKADNASAAGIMWCATKFSTPRPFVATEILNVTYSINSADV